MAHSYTATIRWERGEAAFIDNRYSRAHDWRFDGGITVPASASPLNVRLPLSKAEAVDPEEAFVAALSSCHMLFFLSFAAAEGIVVDLYEDEATGVMARNERGRMVVATVTLKPRLTVSGGVRPSETDIAALHHRAHDECFIANSVLTEVLVEAPPPRFV